MQQVYNLQFSTGNFDAIGKKFMKMI